MDLISNFTITTLDSVVNTFFTSTNTEERSLANKVLIEFQSFDEAWLKVDLILEQSSLIQSKFIALTILDTLIKSKWNILPIQQQQGIKQFIIQIIFKQAQEDNNKLYLSKLNMVLVQILKQDWPLKWPDFITEIVTSSKQNLSLCENNMLILKLLSEEVFDFSLDQMTSSKTKLLKEQLK